MKKFSMLLLSVLLASYSLAVADTDNFEIGNFVIITNDSDKLHMAECSVIALGSAYGMDDSERSVKSDFYEIQLLASLPRKSDELGFSLDFYRSQFSTNLVKKSSPVNFEYGYGGLRPLQFFDVTGSGGSLLSIAAPIKNERNSVPESSTMLLLGLGLVGLSGYGGRKKFKR